MNTTVATIGEKQAMKLREINREIIEIGDFRERHAYIPPRRLDRYENAWEFAPTGVVMALLITLPMIFNANFGSEWGTFTVSDEKLQNVSTLVGVIISAVITLILTVTMNHRHTIYNCFAINFSRLKQMEYLGVRQAYLDYVKNFDSIEESKKSRLKELYTEAEPILRELNLRDTEFYYYVNEYGINSRRSDKFEARTIRAFDLNS